MAVITRTPRESRIKERGAHGIKEALLTGPASGSNRFSAKKIILDPDGCTARTSFDRTVFYFIHEGRISISHDNGELDLLLPGYTATVHADEIHHLHNVDNLKAVVIKVAPQ